MAESNEPSSRLSAINTATIGKPMPEVTLPSGQKIRESRPVILCIFREYPSTFQHDSRADNATSPETGTVDAMVINIRKYDELVAQGGSGSEKEQYELEEKLLAAVPLLKAVGLFDLFKPEEWIHGGSSEGRKFVGQAALRS